MSVSAPVELTDLELEAVSGGGHRQAIDRARNKLSAFTAAVSSAVQEIVDELEQEEVSRENIAISASFTIGESQYTILW